jgi:uncharacterized protein YydD (DUF2326 family)
MVKRSYQEIADEVDEVESQIAELENQFITDYAIQSRDGYVPQSFDEIGDEDLRVNAQEKFNLENHVILAKYEALKTELAETAA